jgi:hypothetical protein
MATKKTAKKAAKNLVTSPARPGKFYTGSMGEHYVMAELLARGFNVSRAVVDEGIDVIAFKPDNPQKLFRIQVKTAFSGGGVKAKKFTFTLGTAAYEQAAGQDYYLVLVMRDDVNDLFVAAVIPKQIFDDYRENQNVIDWNTQSTSMQVAVHLHTNGSITLKNVGGLDITSQTKNRWDRIN